MTTTVLIIEPGDRFGTMSRSGVVRIWEVTAGGIPFIVEGPTQEGDGS
jgi:hypothetical protein